jgi:hypothetical protein
VSLNDPRITAIICPGSGTLIEVLSGRKRALICHTVRGVDKVEARKLLTEFVEDLRKKSYDELVQFIRNPVCVEVNGSSGKQYQIEYEALWDTDPDGLLRIMASIDDGRLISFMFPITESFLIDQDGKLLD